MGEKALILGDNVHDGATLSGSPPIDATFALENLADPMPGERFGAAGYSDVLVRFDHGEEVVIDTIGMVNFDASLSGAVQITITGNSDYTDDGTFQESFDLWPPMYGFGEKFGEFFGGYVDPDAVGIFQPRRLIRLGAQYKGRYVEYRFNDSDGSGDGFKLGYVMAGIGIQFERNFAFPYELDEIPVEEPIETDGGGLILNGGSIYSTMRIAFPALRRSELMSTVRALKRSRGYSKPVFVALFPDADIVLLNQTSIYGVFSRWGAGTVSHFDVAGQDFLIRGLI